ncbi:MAG: hypothetical protein H8E30_06875 [Alphaproteobacteria bacterium]|nr:hypothetical protein [Alphaproteobacteria bacterium]
MYAGDSFFSLPAVGQGALVVLSALLALAAVLFALALFRLWKSLGPRMAATLVIFWLFVWLTPQIYYLFYQTILDGLPSQIVIGGPPGPRGLIDLLLFRGPATLAAHGMGMLGWMLIILGPLATVKSLAYWRAQPDRCPGTQG